MTGLAPLFAAAAVAAGPNPIVAENSLGGSNPSTWSGAAGGTATAKTTIRIVRRARRS